MPLLRARGDHNENLRWLQLALARVGDHCETLTC
jgi:hypothetical protein